MKNSSDTIGNRTRDLPACTAVPQPTALQRAPFIIDKFKNRLIILLYKSEYSNTATLPVLFCLKENPIKVM
jgi:hypothetical protein